MTTLIFYPMLGGYQLSECGDGGVGVGNKTQKIAMKFGMLVIDLGENAVSIDELAHILGCTLMEQK